MLGLRTETTMPPIHPGATRSCAVRARDSTAIRITLLPIWPHPRFAQDYLARDAVAAASWAGSSPVEIDVHCFLDEDLPELLANSYLIAAFPIVPGKAAVVAASDFAANLHHELSQIE